jgi:uncharacterized membrane protein HdeD (DUF308 family)
MESTLASNWWAFVLRGVLAVLFGVIALAIPGVTLLALVLLFGSYALIEGVFNLVAAVRGMEGHDRWGSLLFEGLVSIAAGLAAFAWPGLTALALTFLIAGWALVTGVLEIATAVRLRKLIRGEWLLALSGILSILFAALLAIAPAVGALAIVFWIGAYAIVFGILLVVLGVRLHSHSHAGPHPTMRPLEGV